MVLIHLPVNLAREECEESVGEYARAMAGAVAERAFWGQFLGTGRGRTACLAMKVLFKNLEKLSGQAGDNARERLDLPDIAAH